MIVIHGDGSKCFEDCMCMARRMERAEAQVRRQILELEALRKGLTEAVKIVGKFDDDDVPDSWRIALDPSWKRVAEE